MEPFYPQFSSDTDINVRQSTVLWRWQTDWAGLEFRQPHAVMESLKWSGNSDTEMAFPFYYVINQIFHLISWDELHTLSITRSVKFVGCIWEACNSRINFMRSDEIIPWGFQETAGKFSIKKRGLFDFSRGFCQIWRHTLQHYSGTFLCHADFIPDRSCLDVPVGRKCSACNGLAPEFLHELKYLSEAFYPSLPLNCSKTPRPWRTLSHVGNRCTRIPIRYS